MINHMKKHDAPASPSNSQTMPHRFSGLPVSVRPQFTNIHSVFSAARVSTHVILSLFSPQKYALYPEIVTYMHKCLENRDESVSVIKRTRKAGPVLL